MPSSSYAAVVYLDGDLGKFLTDFRATVAPDQGELRPHLTVLPPRKLPISDADAVAAFKVNVLAEFTVVAGDVFSFRPVTPTIYLDLREGKKQLWLLHDQLGSGSLAGKSDWPYVPHLTLAKLPDSAAASKVFEEARRRWRDYQGTRSFSVTELTLVREAGPDVWVDLASIHAGE